MPADRTITAYVFRTSNNPIKEVIIRPQREGEQGNFNPVRIIVPTSQVLTVSKLARLEMEQALVFRPEEKWKRCPRCRKIKWSAWLPIQFLNREIQEGGMDQWPRVNWLVMCIHCASTVALRNHGPYAEDPGEYLYDPAGKEKFLSFPA